MKKLLLFLFSAFAFAACEQAPIEEQSAIRYEAPETITVGFECDETRIQLNEAQKTVWTKGDHVSVFYRSNANQQWKYNGETGARTAELKRVDAGNATETMKRVVVVYPYNGNYYINTETYNVQASLPATQHYLANSYGLDGNIMISSAEYNDVTLKNVCGWLKLQLTGDGEVVKSITFKGNNGEQVAGELYINSAEATAILASEMGNIAEDDGNNATGGAGANLSFDDVVLKEVTLDCATGVTLGAEATSFYIALPPQTFEKGFKVEIVCADDTKMVKSSSNSLSIERNHIQPMAEFEYETIPNNQIWYTSSDGDVVTPYYTNVFGAKIISNTYNNGKGVITFDGDVRWIGEWAFFSRNSLTSINIPDSVTWIGERAFYSCSSLTSVTIGDSVTSIGERAFQCCQSLTSVIIGDSVTSIGNQAFNDCNSLKEFKGKFATEDGCSLIVDNTIIAYANASGNTYTIPDSVTTIGESAFYGCDSLISVNIPDSVTMIGDLAFGWCYSLTSVNIPDSVTTIGENAFECCTSLTSVNIPDSVTTIGNYAFKFCESLTSVNIGDSVTSIGNQAFSCCDSLKEFKGKFAEDNGRILVVDGVLTAFAPAGITEYTIPDSVTTIGNSAFWDCDSLTSVNIPDSVTTIGECAFEYCTSLTSITIPDSVTSIGASAFYSCYSLTSVNIPDSVMSIGNYAFSYCKSLTSVNIPDSVTTIGDYAFYSCNSLTSVYCKATTPPALGGTSVFDNNGSGRKIYVPTESVDAYKSATNWSDYKWAIVGYDFENGVVVE